MLRKTEGKKICYTQIMLSSSKKAEDQEDQWIVDENSTILTTIFEKANKVWNLGLK